MEKTYGKTTRSPARRLVSLLRHTLLLLNLILCLALAGCNSGDSASPPTRGFGAAEFRIIPAGEILYSHPQHLYTTPWFYLLFLAGPSGLLIVILLKKHKRRKLLVGMLILLGTTASLGGQEDIANLLRQGVDQYLTGSASESLHYFLLAAENLSDNPLLYYNLALCYVKLDKPGQAIYYLKQAQQRTSTDQRLSRFLQYLETTYQLGYQVDSNPHFNPDIPLSLCLGFYTLAFILLAILQYIRKAHLIIALILCGTFVFFSLGVFLYEQIHTHQKIGVIIDGLAPIKQIPEEMGIEKIKLKEGTIVRVLWQYEDNFFIRTGRGLKGWIKTKHLLLDKW